MRRIIPSTPALLCFEAAARAQSFVQAAHHMNMSQSALGRQIKGLEAQIGLPLFHREKQRVRLTGVGRNLLEEVSPQLVALEEIFHRLRAHTEPEGSFVIGCDPTLGRRWLMPLLRQMRVDFPGLTVNTVTFLENDQIDASVLDLAIAQGDPPWPDFRADLLMGEELIAVCAPGFARTTDPETLLDLPALQHRTRPRSWRIWFDGQGIAMPRNPTGPMFSQFDMLIDAACHGQGVAVVPKLLVKDELEAGRLTFAHPFICTPISAYYLLTPQAKAGTGRVDRVRGWIMSRSEQSGPPGAEPFS